MTSTGTDAPLVEICIYEQIGVRAINDPLPMRAETTVTVSDSVSVDDDALWEWSDYESDPNVDWHCEFENGECKVWYEPKFCVIGFRPEEGKRFLSKNNDSDLFIFGVKHGRHNENNRL